MSNITSSSDNPNLRRCSGTSEEAMEPRNATHSRCPTCCGTGWMAVPAALVGDPDAVAEVERLRDENRQLRDDLRRAFAPTVIRRG